MSKRLLNANRITKRFYYDATTNNKTDLSHFLQNKYNEYIKEQEFKTKDTQNEILNKISNIRDEIRCINIKIDNQNKELQKIYSLLNIRDVNK